MRCGEVQTSSTTFNQNVEGCMKYVVIVVVSMLAVMSTVAQNRFSSVSESQLNEIRVSNQVGNPNVSVVAIINSAFDSETLEAKGITVRTLRGSIATLNVPLSEIDFIEKYIGFDFAKVPDKIAPNIERAIMDVRADSVHLGIDLPAAFSGQNVLIGVTDWGFDYTHPMFYDTANNQTRILAAWDQYKRSGPSPAGYDYGTEYNSSAALLSAESDTANIYSYSTHGSHVAGIAGGSGAGTEHRGVAFGAQFLFLTFLVDEAAVIDGFEWMYQISQTEGKRLVINMSWGLYYFGTLDGNSVMSEVIKTYSDLGVVFVTSGGNNGDANFHIGYEFESDTMRTEVEFVPNNAVNFQDGQSITCWGEPNESFAIKLEVFDNSGNSSGSSAWFNTNDGDDYLVDSLIIGADTYHFDVAIDESHPRNNRPHIRLRIDYPPSGNIVLNAAANSGTVHFWNVLETTTGVGNTGWDFNDLLPGFVPGDNQYGIGEPAASKDAISVGAYLANLDLNGQKVTYDIAGFSSLGPTLDGRTKPDLCAPGVSVASSISSFTDRSYSPVESITFNGRTYDFAKFSGTSMASPVVAGIVALMLEANPYLTPSEIKEILQETCRYDDKTGDLSSGPNNTWGYGKVNAYSAVQRAAQLNGVFRSTLSDQVSIYPNPSERIVGVSSPELIQRLELWSIDGKEVFELNNSESEFSTQGLAPGVYHLWIYTESSVVIKQLIKL